MKPVRQKHQIEAGHPARKNRNWSRAISQFVADWSAHGAKESINEPNF
jgi:hypothetical protein